MTVVFDHVGAGGSDLSAYDRTKYSSLSGYADDVLEIGTELGLKVPSSSGIPSAA
jgi:sigma-B regulation protein RsbQ